MASIDYTVRQLQSAGFEVEQMERNERHYIATKSNEAGRTEYVEFFADGTRAHAMSVTSNTEYAVPTYVQTVKSAIHIALASLK